MPNPVKVLDLQRNGRCAIHAYPGKDGDAKVAGIAIEATDVVRFWHPASEAVLCG